MAANAELFGNGMPVPFYNEMFVLVREAVDFEVDKIPQALGGKVYTKGTIYLSNVWMVFVANKPVGAFLAFDLPLLYIHDEKFNQPIFVCNNISGKVDPVVCEDANRALLILSRLFLRKMRHLEPILYKLDNLQLMRCTYVDPNDPTRIFLQQPEPESQLRRRTYYSQTVENYI